MLAGLRLDGSWDTPGGVRGAELFARADGEILGASAFVEGSASLTEWSALAGVEWRF